MATMNISLPATMKTFVESQVATGQFSNVSDYIRDIIRERQTAVDRLRGLLEEGEASGISPLSFDDAMVRIRERHRSSAG